MQYNQPARLPLPFLWIVIAVCLLPTALNLCGFDFSTRGQELGRATVLNSIADTPDLLETHPIKGPLVHTVLEWSAFCVAVVTVVFSFIQFSVRRDSTTPIIGMAMFASGLFDALNVLAANGLILRVSDYREFIPFTWAISRSFNICIMIAGASLFLRRKPDQKFGSARRSGRYLLLIGLFLSVLAFVIVQTAAYVPKLPHSLFPNSNVPRPWDAMPLILYLFAGGIFFPRYYRMHPGLFSHALIVGVLPQIATQLHAAFGSRELYDNHFNIAYFLKIFAYAVPLIGLILEYIRTYQGEIRLRAAEESLQMARIVQQEMLPQRPPKLPGFDIAGRSFPAEAVGGDYFDYIEMSDGAVAIVTADVSGHDIGASIFMTQTRAYLRALAGRETDTVSILRRLNRLLTEDGRHERFVALFFAKLNPKKRTMTCCPAGYMSYLLQKSGKWRIIESDCVPLGILSDDSTMTTEVIHLETSELFVSFTDGVVEAASPAGEQFGVDRTLAAIVENKHLSAEEIVSRLYETIEDFCGGSARTDDVTVVVLKSIGTAKA
ncbi:MAG: PP2C family protein-serine/threonine phosphatase [Planctomyces sp.]